MNFPKKPQLLLLIFIFHFTLNCSQTTYKSYEQGSYLSKTSIQINIEPGNQSKSALKDIIVELKNKSRSFNYFGVTDSTGTIIFKEIVDDNYDLFISGNLNRSIEIKKNTNQKISVKI